MDAARSKCLNCSQTASCVAACAGRVAVTQGFFFWQRIFRHPGGPAACSLVAGLVLRSTCWRSTGATATASQSWRPPCGLWRGRAFPRRPRPDSWRGRRRKTTSTYRGNRPYRRVGRAGRRNSGSYGAGRPLTAQSTPSARHCADCTPPLQPVPRSRAGATQVGVLGRWVCAPHVTPLYRTADRR